MAPGPLYTVCILVWGTTWFALTFQLGTVPVTVSVTWRFAVAAIILIAIARWRGLWRPMSVSDHLATAAQGILTFAVAYSLTYAAGRHLPSGLLAVANSNVLFLNILFGALWFGQPVRPRVVVGALVGVVGMIAIFAPDLGDFRLDGGPLLGLLLVLVACVATALGNQLAASQARAGVPVAQYAGLAMGWGAAALGLVTFGILGETPRFLIEPGYLLSFLWLTLFGSVLVFLAYYALIARIGADRAAYAFVAHPVVALMVSTVFEGYRWTGWSLAGAALVALGNLVALSRSRVARPAAT